MRFSVLSTVAALASVASAIPRVKLFQAFPAAGGVNYTWSITNWEAGSTRSGGHYNFNITGAAKTTGNQVPAFHAYCSGYNQPQPYTLCTLYDGLPGQEVAAKLTPANTTTDPGAHLAVSFEFPDVTEENMWWNYTAYTVQPYNQFASPPMNFTILPTEIYGVA